jgi:hypothetical protein
MKVQWLERAEKNGMEEGEPRLKECAGALLWENEAGQEVREKSSIEKGPVKKRRWLVYQAGDSTLEEREVDWVCFAEQGDEELILNGFIPANFTFHSERLAKADATIRIYSRVNPARNPYIDCQYVILYPAYGTSYILVNDLASLIDFFYHLEEAAVHS